MIRLTEEKRTTFTAVDTIPQGPDCTERGELAEHEHRFASADASGYPWLLCMMGCVLELGAQIIISPVKCFCWSFCLFVFMITTGMVTNSGIYITICHGRQPCVIFRKGRIHSLN